jgi:hypothetical protein
MRAMRPQVTHRSDILPGVCHNAAMSQQRFSALMTHNGLNHLLVISSAFGLLAARAYIPHIATEDPLHNGISAANNK